MTSPAASRPAPTTLQRVHGVLRRVPTVAVYLVLMIPAALYVYLAFADRLGADPAATLEKALGEWALRLLIAGLAVSPLRELTGLNLVRFRRVIGLAAFSYVVLHLTAYLWLDREFDWTAIIRDITRRPYIILGMAAFVMLVPLAITSTNAMIRRLGPKAWSRLHKLAYVAALFGAAHYLLLVKSWPLQPIVYAAIVVLLVVWRFLPATWRTRRRA